MMNRKNTTDTAVLVLDKEGMIEDCDNASETLFGYPCSSLTGQHISLVLPELKKFVLMQDGKPSPHVRFLARVGHRFEVVTGTGSRLASEIFLNATHHFGPDRLRLIVRSLSGRTETGPESRKDARAA